MQELEKILEDINENTINLFSGVNMISAKKVEKILRKHMNDGWIPAEERLPTKEERKKDNNNFLVQVDSGERFSCEYDPEANGYDNPQWCCNIPVVAWRPLPEPYHPERSDKNDGE